jgi:hypothetical protein
MKISKANKQMPFPFESTPVITHFLAALPGDSRSFARRDLFIKSLRENGFVKDTTFFSP